MLTFAGRVPRPSIAYGHAWRHFRQATELSSQPYARLLMALRQEWGEHNGGYSVKTNGQTYGPVSDTHPKGPRAGSGAARQRRPPPLWVA